MSSAPSVLRARPRVRLAPRARSLDDAADAIELASRYGLTPDDWQADVLEDWLGRTAAGRWSAATCGLAVPRQNGKNGVLEMRELFGMVLLGEKILHTAHEVKTARKAFLRIASFFENPRQFPELASLAREVRKTNGQEAIVLTNGGSIEFIARSKGSGRGFTVDILVCDEAQDLTDEELAALLPMISAAPLGNPQMILTGTPPDPEKPDAPQGEVFRRVRGSGRDKSDKHLAWTDFGAADGPLPDVDDREAWYRYNPALGLRLNVAEVERERGLMNPPTFARERLGWWGDPEAAGSVIDVAAWVALAIELEEWPESFTLALDVAPDRSAASIGVAGAWGDRTLVMAYTGRGTAWVAEKVAELVQERRISEVSLFPSGQAGALVPDLIEAGVAFEKLTGQQMGAACAGFQESVKAGALCHLSQPELDVAVANARTRYMSEAEVWDRRKPGIDISPLVACSAAAYRWGLGQHVTEVPAIF